MRICLVGILFLVLVASPAAAVDLVGAKGRVVAVEHVTPSSDTHNAYHGRIFVETAGQLQDYSWGGQVCNAHQLSDSNVLELEGALGNPRIVIEPSYQTAINPAERCLVSWKLILREWQGLF